MLNREIVQLFRLVGGGLTDGRTLAAFSVARLCTREQSLGVGVGFHFHLGTVHPPFHEYRTTFGAHTASLLILTQLPVCLPLARQPVCDFFFGRFALAAWALRTRMRWLATGQSRCCIGKCRATCTKLINSWSD